MVYDFKQTSKTEDVPMIQKQQFERKHQTTQLTRMWRVVVHQPKTV